MPSLKAASDSTVLFSAIGGLVFFVCFFVHVLLCVPQHWGVPYNTRLKRHLAISPHGFIIEILNGVFSIASCVLFVMETYDRNGSDYRFLVRSFSLELAFNGFFLCNFLVHLYMAVDKFSHLLSVQALVDIVTVGPSYAILLNGLRTTPTEFADVYLGIKVTRVFRVARLLVTISFFVQGPSLAFDHSRQILVLRSQFMRRCLQTLVVIFIMTGLTHFLVEVQDADWGTGPGTMAFHDALYYIVVSFSTVGYGDISPSTALSRLLIAGLIMSLFFCAPLVTNTLVNFIRVTPQHSGRLAKGFGTGHIVVGCDSSCLRVVSVLLRELLAPDSMAFHTAHVVIVVPQEPTLEWEALLCLQPAFVVTYLNGDLRSSEDLRRARVGHARACFVLSDRLAADTEDQDKTALLRALCAHQASPPGASVLCMVTHAKSKGRLVRLGVPAESVVCYDDVMEALVAHACLHAGFSTVWANILSCMPETGHLLKARAAEQATVKGPLAMRIFETEMEYLRSLQRVMIRFHLDAFSGEYVGDVALELYRECECVLLALICTTCSGGHEGGSIWCGSTGGDNDVDYGSGSDNRGQRCARVRPDYHAVLRNDDVGVFIGANQKAGDCIARYCAARVSSGSSKPTSERPEKFQSEGKATSPPPRILRRMARQSPFGRQRRFRKTGPERPMEITEWPQQEQDRPASSGTRRPLPFDLSGRRLSPTSSLFSSMYLAGEQRLLAPPPGFVLIITQSLSFALGVVLTLCEADADFEGDGGPSSSAVTVLCSPAWWDHTVHPDAERELATRFPSVRVCKISPETQGLLECRADRADLVCVVSSRVSEKHERKSDPCSPEDSGEREGVSGFGNFHSGRGQGSDGWAMGVVVDVLGVVPASTRVVVRFDEATSAEQHQVISAHVRRRTVALETERKQQESASREKVAEVAHGGTGAGLAVNTIPAHRKLSTDKTLRGGIGTISDNNAASVGGGSYRRALPEFCDFGGYFDDTRGVVHEGFDDFFATMSGYSSGDVVIGNAAELLLLQTMLASDIQSLMNDVLNLASRVPVEILWPGDFSTIDGDSNTGGSNKRTRPATYGEAYQLLLCERDLLALGIHRPPVHIGGGNSKRTSAAGAPAAPCPGGSRYLAITCPSPSFPLCDGDCLFVLRPRSDASATVDPGAGEGEACGLSSEQGMQRPPDGDEISRDASTSATIYTAATHKSKVPLPSNVPAASVGNVAAFAVTCEEEKYESVDPKDDNPWKLNAGLEATRPAEGSEPPLTTGADSTPDSETIAAEQNTDSNVERALGLARTSPHRVDCSERSGGEDIAWVDGGQPLLRQRVLDAAERAAAAHSVSRDASVTVEDEPESFGVDSGGGGQEEGVLSLPPVGIGTDKTHASSGGKAVAVRPENLVCSG